MRKTRDFVAHSELFATVEEMSDETSATDGQVFEGPITIIKTGKGFFTYDPEKDDLFVPGENLGAVSYTHLTLPTKRIV